MKFPSVEACVIVLLLTLVMSKSAQAEGDLGVREPALVGEDELPDLWPVCCGCDSLIVAGDDSCWRDGDHHDCDGHVAHADEEGRDDGSP